MTTHAPPAEASSGRTLATDIPPPIPEPLVQSIQLVHSTVPISADRFEDIPEDEEGPTPGTNAYDVLSFLESNPDQAFTQTEIVQATGVNRGSVGPTLVRLREAGRVDHRGTYWRISDHVRSLDAALGHASEVAASHEDTLPDYEAWQDHAVDPRDDRG